jgi:hypothetical protein
MNRFLGVASGKVSQEVSANEIVGNKIPDTSSVRRKILKGFSKMRAGTILTGFG